MGISEKNRLRPFKNALKDCLWACCQSLITVAQIADNNLDSYDTYMMFNYGNPTQVTPYFTVKGRDLAVNVFKSLPYETDINFLSEQSNDAKLSVENIPEGVDIYIVNNADGSEFLLNEGEFSFTADQGSNAGKYKIKFVSKKSALEDVVSSNISVFNDNQQVSISGNSLQNVEVINTLG